MKLRRCLCGGKAVISYQPADDSERNGLPGVVVGCERCGEHTGVWSYMMSVGLMIKQARYDWNKKIRYLKKIRRLRIREEWYIKYCISRQGKGKTISLFQRMEQKSKMELETKKKTQ